MAIRLLLHARYFQLLNHQLLMIRHGALCFDKRRLIPEHLARKVFAQHHPYPSGSANRGQEAIAT